MSWEPSGRPRCLVLSRDAGGERHFLNGRGVHAGTVLELRLESGKWLQVRYESEWSDRLRPAFYMRLAGHGSAKLILPDDAVLRWPDERVRGQARASDVIDPTGDCELVTAEDA